jgi:hypothetical protein
MNEPQTTVSDHAVQTPTPGQRLASVNDLSATRPDAPESASSKTKKKKKKLSAKVLQAVR